MGREIRRVAAGWEHPRDYRGNYKPLYGGSYAAIAAEWHDDYIAWHAGTHEHAAECKTEYPYYFEFAGSPPDKGDYAPDWPEAERTHYQVYENVSEGTPTSPVFATVAELHEWLIAEGYSEAAATAFIDGGYHPSGIMFVSSGVQHVGFGTPDAMNLLADAIGGTP